MIGTTTIEYDESGTPTSTKFEPQLQVQLNDDLRQQLMSVKGTEGSARIKEQSELVLGAWFAGVSEIELADREEFEVASEVVECEKYDGGGVRKCVMRFSLRKRG